MLHINLVLFIHAITPQFLIYKPIKLTVIQHKGYEYDNQEIPNIFLFINGNIFIRVPDINRILNDISNKAIQGIGSGFLGAYTYGVSSMFIKSNIRWISIYSCIIMKTRISLLQFEIW